jgi:hypothetical protein
VRFLLLSSLDLLSLMPYFVAVVTVALAGYGVKLYVDRQAEEMYLETEPEFCHKALAVALRIVDRLGLEVMSEDEHPAERSPSGGIRIWLAEAA